MILKTALYDAHRAAGAKMGHFAGYDMPLFYSAGALKEHEWVRSHCGIFDVSHMGQITIEGSGAAEFLERITPSSFQDLPDGRAQYTVLTNEKGGIVDDLIVTRFSEKEFFLVLNAGRKTEDIAWIKQHLPMNLRLHQMGDQALIAVQGRWSERIVHEILECETADIPYMSAIKASMPSGAPVILSRLGYTGEDGFEISIAETKAPALWQDLTGHPEALPAGLAARDSLRLEMGYPLYGHDIDEATTLVEAGLGWIIGKDNTGFIGAEKILAQKQEGPSHKRVGIKLLDKGIAREGAEIMDEHEEPIGALTSGGFSPALQCGIGMGYVPASYAQIGTQLSVDVRGRLIPAKVTKLPFIPASTKTMKKN